MTKDKDIISEWMAEIGRRGGAARGKAKRRDPAHYKKMARAAKAAREKREAKP